MSSLKGEDTHLRGEGDRLCSHLWGKAFWQKEHKCSWNIVEARLAGVERGGSR